MVCCTILSSFQIVVKQLFVPQQLVHQALKLERWSLAAAHHGVDIPQIEMHGTSLMLKAARVVVQVS